MKQAVVACLLYVTASQVTEAFGGRGKFGTKKMLGFPPGGGKFRLMNKNQLKNGVEKISEFCETSDFDSELCNCAEIMKTDRLSWSDEQTLTARSCKDKLREKLKSKLQANLNAEELSPVFSELREARREKISDKCETLDGNDLDAVFRCRCLKIREIEPENRSVEEVAATKDCLERREENMMEGGKGGKFRKFKEQIQEKKEEKIKGLDGKQKILAKKCMKARMAVRSGLAGERVNEFFRKNCGEFQRMNAGELMF